MESFLSNGHDKVLVGLVLNSCIDTKAWPVAILPRHATFPDLYRRNLELDERKYLMGRGVVTETQSNMGMLVYCTTIWPVSAVIHASTTCERARLRL